MIETTIGVSHSTKEELRKLMAQDEEWDYFLFEIYQFIRSNQKEWKEWRQKNHESFPDISS